MASRGGRTAEGRSREALREDLGRASTSRLGAYEVGKAVAKHSLTLRELKQEGLLAPLLRLLHGDPTSEAGYYSLHAIHIAFGNNEQELRVLGEQVGSTEALIGVLRSGRAEHVPACQHISSALLWSMSACVEMMPRMVACPGMARDLLAALASISESTVQVAVSGVLASLATRAPFHRHFQDLPEGLSTLTAFLLASKPPRGSTALPPPSSQDSVFMRIHGMQFLAVFLSSAPSPSPADAEHHAVLLQELLLWLLFEDADAADGPQHSATLRQQLAGAHQAALTSVLEAVAHLGLPAEALWVDPRGDAMATKLAELYLEEPGSSIKFLRLGFGRLRIAILELLAQLCQHSPSWRSHVAGQERLLAALPCTLSPQQGNSTLKDTDWALASAAVALLSQLAQDAALALRIIDGQGLSCLMGLMPLLGQLSMAFDDATTACDLVAHTADLLHSLVVCLPLATTDPNQAIWGRHTKLAALARLLAEQQADLGMQPKLASTLSRLVVSIASHRRPNAAAAAAAATNPEVQDSSSDLARSDVLSATGQLLQRASSSAKVALAHGLRQAAVIGPPQDAADMVAHRELTEALAGMLSSGRRAISSLPANDHQAEMQAAENMEVAEVAALLVQSLAVSSLQATSSLATHPELLDEICALSQLEVSDSCGRELFSAATGASAAAAGALAAIASWAALPGNCATAVEDALPHNYSAVAQLLLLLSQLPATPPASAVGTEGGGARGGAEHVAALLAVVTTSLKDGVELVASALLDSAGTLEILLAMLPQPPVTKGEVVPDVEWKDGAVPTAATFGVGGAAVLRLLQMLVQAPDVARVIADEVEIFPPLLWACLTRSEAECPSSVGMPGRPREETSQATLAITAVHLLLSALEPGDKHDALAVPFILDALLAGLRSSDSTATAAAALAVSSLSGLPAFQALLTYREKVQLSRLMLNKGATAAAPPLKFTRQGAAIMELLVARINPREEHHHSREKVMRESNSSEMSHVSSASTAYMQSLASQTSLHVAWAAKQLVADRKICTACAESPEITGRLVRLLEGERSDDQGRPFGLVAACTVWPGAHDKGVSSHVNEEELWTMAHTASTLADMLAVAPLAGQALAGGAGVIRGLLMVLRGKCLLPASAAGDLADQADPGENDRRQAAVLEMRMCATRLLGAIAFSLVEDPRSATSTQKQSATSPSSGQEGPMRPGSVRDDIRRVLKPYAMELALGCVGLMDSRQDPNLQAEGIYAMSRLISAEPELAEAFGAAGNSIESCLEIILAAGKRGIAPDKVNAVAVAAAAATKTLCIVTRTPSSPARARLAADKRLGRACAIMLEECSYVRLRQLFPGLAAEDATGEQQQGTVAQSQQQQAASNSSLGGDSKRHHNKGSMAGGPGNNKGVSFQTGGSIMGSRSMAMQGSGLASLSESKDFDESEGGPGEVKDVRIITAEIIANVAAIDGAGSQALLDSRHSIMSPLVGLLKMEDRHATTIASSAMWAMSTTDKGAELVGSEKRHGMMHLVKLLRTKRYPAAQANAAGCLASLARIETNLERMGTLEGCTSGLVNLMLSASQALEDIAEAPLSIGGWKAGIESETADPSLLEDQLVSAVAAIASMSNSGPVAARIASTKGLTKGLSMTLRSKSPKVQLYAAGAMGNLANHTASLAVVTAARGLVRAVVRLTRHGGSPEVVETAAGALRNLAACERGREELAKESTAVQSLVALVSEQDGEGKETQLQAQLKAAGALGNLSADRQGLEAMAKDADGYVASLIKVLRSKQVDAKLARYALVALSNGASHPVIAGAMLKNGAVVPTFAGNLRACLRSGHAGLGRNGMASARPSSTNLHAAAASGTAGGRDDAENDCVAQVCYMEGLRQLAGASSGGGGPGALEVLRCGGAELLDGIQTTLMATSDFMLHYSYAEDGEDSWSSSRKAAAFLGTPSGDDDPTAVPLSVGSSRQRLRVDDISYCNMPESRERQVKLDMAAAAAGLLAQLQVASVDGALPESLIDNMEQACAGALQPLLDLLTCDPGAWDDKDDKPQRAAVCGPVWGQIAFSLWVLCLEDRRGLAVGASAATPRHEQACRAVVDCPEAVKRLVSFVADTASDDGQVRAIRLFDPARLLGGAILGRLAAQGYLSPEAIDNSVGCGPILSRLLADLLHCPPDGRRSSQSLREVEADTHTSAEGAVAAALGAGLGEAGMHGPARRLLVADAANSLGHISSMPEMVESLEGVERLVCQLCKLLDGEMADCAPAGGVLEAVLTALGGLSAYSPEARTLLADMAEDSGHSANLPRNLATLLRTTRPALVQAYAATTIGHLAAERDTVAAVLANGSNLAALAAMQAEAARSNFGASNGPAGAGFVSASICGCLMSLAQTSPATCAQMTTSSPVLDAIGLTLELAGSKGRGDPTNEIAVSCVAYAAATVAALLAASEETHAAVASHKAVTEGLVQVLLVPQPDAQGVALLALCSLVSTSSQPERSARCEWRSGTDSNSSEEAQRIRDLIDGCPGAREAIGELTGADGPEVRHRAAWLLSQ